MLHCVCCPKNGFRLRNEAENKMAENWRSFADDRAVYDKLNEVLAELQRIENGGTVDDELMANVKLIAEIIDNLYIKSAI